MEPNNNEEFQLDDGFSGSAANAPTTGTSYHYSSITSDTSQSGSNLLLGLLGAVIGAVPGCLLWLGLGYAGFIAGIAGYVIMLGAMFCYEKFSGALDKKGVISCIIVTCIAILFANVLDYAIEIYKYLTSEGYEADFFTVLINTPTMIKEAEMTGGFALNLVIGYALTGLSCHKTLASKF